MKTLTQILTLLFLMVLSLSSLNAQTVNPANALLDIDFSPDGTQIAGARYDGMVLVWNAATGVITHSFSAHVGGATEIAWSPDGTKIASGGFDGLINVWTLDSYTGSVLGSVGDTITGLEWLAPNLVVASGEFDTWVKIWDADTGVLVNQYGGASYQMVAHANGSGGKTAVHVTIGNAHIFDLATGSPIRNIPVPGGDVFGASWNPTVSELVTTGSDGVVRIWNVANGTQRLAFTAHTAVVIAVDWSPDGAQIASLDRSGKVYVWDAASGQVLNSFNVFSSTVTWSPDSQRLAYSAGNGSIVIVDPTPDNLLTNGTFASGALAPWTTAAAPNPADLVWRIQGGVLEFYRTTTSTFGAISQTTGTALPALTPLEARLSIGNSSGVRRRLTVTLEDASDGTRLQNCVFWLPANAPLRTFIVRTYTPQAWRCCNGCT